MALKFGTETEQERKERQQISDATAQRIGPLVRDGIVAYFRSLGLSTIDDAGAEQVALFKESTGIKGHTWTGWSRKKTGTHSEYCSDGVHVLDEHTAYTITVSLVVCQDGVPLLHVGDYTRSKLVGGSPVIASNFDLEVPSQLAAALETTTGIKQVGEAEFLRAQVR